MMVHLPYIFAAYVLAIGLPLSFAIEALLRNRSARRRLQVMDTRRVKAGSE
jgi:hypothetical protein